MLGARGAWRQAEVLLTVNDGSPEGADSKRIDEDVGHELISRSIAGLGKALQIPAGKVAYWRACTAIDGQQVHRKGSFTSLARKRVPVVQAANAFKQGSP